MKEAINVTGLISIITPVYNSEKYLHRCIKSVINQDYKKIEMIIIDDGSTDKSGKICDEYRLSDKRVKVIHTKNKGPSAARNTGIENSKGEFIFFVDSDDSLEKDSLSLLIKSYNQHKADIIVGDFKKIKDDVSESGHSRFFSGSKILTKQEILDYIKLYLKKPNRFPLFGYSWGRLFRSSIIKKNNISFDPDLRTHEDVAFNFIYLKYTNEIFFLKKAIYNHFIYEDYTSAGMKISNHPKDLFGYRKALVNLSEFLKDNYSDAEIRKEIGHAYVCYTIIQLVRTCGQINDSNHNKIYEFIREIVNDRTTRNNLRFYSPSDKDSRIIPLLMKMKLVLPIISVCKYKANKRYGKKGRVK